jgi:cytidylate kinase
MYRTAAHKLLSLGIPIDAGEPAPGVIRPLLEGDQFEFLPEVILFNGRPIDAEVIFTESMGKAASLVAEFLEVRLILQAEQRRLARLHPNTVAEGRDMGTVVFPTAEYKFFFTAAAKVQAQRYALKKQLPCEPESPEFMALVHEFEERNLRDTSRRHHPLRQPEDARVIATDNLSREAVLDQLYEVLDPCLRPTA